MRRAEAERGGRFGSDGYAGTGAWLYFFKICFKVFKIPPPPPPNTHYYQADTFFRNAKNEAVG